MNHYRLKNWSGATRPGSCSLLLLLFLALLSSRAGAAWQITEFEIVQGFPDWDVVYLNKATLSETKPGDKIAEFPTKEKLKDNANSGSHNIPGHLKTIQQMLNKIATQYSHYGLPEPTHLQKSEDGKRYRIYFYNFALSEYDQYSLDKDTETVGGRTNSNCMKKKDIAEGNGSKPGWIAFNTPRVFPQKSQGIGHYDELLFDSLSHELFHAVQAAAYFGQSGRESYCAASPIWSEGTATAVGIYMANAVYPDYVTSKDRIGESKQGWFNFRSSWLKAGRALGKGDRNRDVYTVNPIFRYAMERYADPYGGREGARGLFDGERYLPRHTGGEDFRGLAMAKLYLENLEDLGSLDYWLNNLLETANKLMPLPVYFSEFLAHHADSADRYSVDENKWVETLFDTCIAVSLKRGQPWESPKGTMLQDNAAMCLDVTVSGLKKDECLYVNLAVDRKVGRNEYGITGRGKNDIDRLHLSSPKMGGKLVDRGTRSEYDCYEQSLKGFEPRCVFPKPLTSENGDYRVSRSWFTPKQRATGNTLKNRYILSATRTNYSGQPEDQPINLKISAEQTSVKRDGKKIKCPSSGVDTSIGSTNPHPVTAQLPGKRQLATVTAPFLVGFGSPDALDPDKEGISSIVLKEFNDNTPDAKLIGKYMFEFRTEKPILFGSKGTYPAAISGSRIGNTGGIVGNPGNQPSGTIKVIRFDDQLLHVKVSGRYCMRTLSDPHCRGNHPVSGEVIKSFGWTYDRAQKPTAIFTPGMEPYARLIEGLSPSGPKPEASPSATTGESAATSSGTAAAAAANTGPTAPAAISGSATGASGQIACDCSCAAKDRLEAELEALEDAYSGEGMTDMSKFPMQAMGCMMQCMMQFTACEDD